MPPGFERSPGSLAVAAANNLYAGGAQPSALMIQAQLPPSYEEADLQKDMESLAEGAKDQGLEILGGHTQVTPAVSEPVYTATGIGRVISEAGRRLLEPGDTLVLTKWIALGGTATIACRYESELGAHYPFALIDKAKEFEKLMSVASEARAVNHFGPAAVHDLSQGGVFGALWEMAERADVGLEVDLKKIPVRQETVEICEYFDVNPYELYSAGALLIGIKHGESLVRELAQCQIPAVVIGQVTDQTGRVIRNGEDVRYLDRPKQDAWYRLTER
jgi:hydrogenase maturation factor